MSTTFSDHLLSICRRFTLVYFFVEQLSQPKLVQNSLIGLGWGGGGHSKVVKRAKPYSKEK